jgi:lipid-A-disaccharide synthase
MTRATAGGAAAALDNVVLLVAGEASGDRIAASIARRLRRDGVRCFGMGGAASCAAGVELVADLRRSAAMGLTEVAARLPAVVRAFVRLVAAARDKRPRAAVLIDYTEFNLRLGAFLRRRGVPVLWCVAPQVWAWRPRRVAHVARALDRLAVILPFEAPLWRAAGVDAHYVGHPALDARALDRTTAHARLGLGNARPNIALLPGSRPHEVRRHAGHLLAAVSELERRGLAVDARLFASASLDAATRRWLHDAAGRSATRVIDIDAEEGASAWLGAFDAAIAASGTATLECALAGVPPVIVYRLSPLTAAVARHFLRTPFVGLPNVMLAAKVYPELLGHAATPARMAHALRSVFEQRGAYAAHARELRARLAWQPSISSSATTAPAGDTTAERIVSLLSPWLTSPRHQGAARAPEAHHPGSSP